MLTRWISINQKQPAPPATLPLALRNFQPNGFGGQAFKWENTAAILASEAGNNFDKYASIALRINANRKHFYDLLVTLLSLKAILTPVCKNYSGEYCPGKFSSGHSYYGAWSVAVWRTHTHTHIPKIDQDPRMLLRYWAEFKNRLNRWTGSVSLW